ncbi:MAG: hypothetical protein HY332_15670 [Chloroflexi bacterium]|nr:hypothetical protein [Chloroflexota bacterium]
MADTGASLSPPTVTPITETLLTLFCAVRPPADASPELALAGLVVDAPPVVVGAGSAALKPLCPDAMPASVTCDDDRFAAVPAPLPPPVVTPDAWILPRPVCASAPITATSPLFVVVDGWPSPPHDDACCSVAVAVAVAVALPAHAQVAVGVSVGVAVEAGIVPAALNCVAVGEIEIEAAAAPATSPFVPVAVGGIEVAVACSAVGGTSVAVAVGVGGGTVLGVGVTVRGTSVAVAVAVTVGGTSVAVAVNVAVGGTSAGVGEAGTGVAVGGAGAVVGGAEVAVDDTAVAVGGTGVFVGPTGVALAWLVALCVSGVLP